MELNIHKYNDFWMDNAIQNFYHLLKIYDVEKELNISLNDYCLNILCNKEVFKKIIVKILKDYKNFACVKQEEKNNTIKEYKKDFILIQHKRKKEDSSISLNPELFHNPEEEISKLVDLIEEGNKKCNLCGSSFKKKYSNLTQSSYPYATKIKSLNGVRSYKNGTQFQFKDYTDSLCPVCYLIGIFGWLSENLIYRTFFDTGKSYLFLPNFNTLTELNSFKEDYSIFLNNSQRLSNIKISLNNEKGEMTEGRFSSLLCFYSKFNLINEDVINCKWQILEIPLGKVKNVKTLNFKMKKNILNIIKFFTENDEDIYIMFKSFNFITSNKIDWDITNSIRENLAKSFLNNDFDNFSKNFIPKKGGKLIFNPKNIEFKYFDIFIRLWRVNGVSVTEEDLKSIKSVGNILAKVSITNLTLFYKLDKVNNLNDFWSCLREISRKLVNADIDRSKIRETSLDELIKILKRNEDNWKEVRDLLIIYSSMYYSIGKRSDDNEN